MSKEDVPTEIESETAALALADPDDYHRAKRLKSIHDAREYLKKHIDTGDLGPITIKEVLEDE